MGYHLLTVGKAQMVNKLWSTFSLKHYFTVRSHPLFLLLRLHSFSVCYFGSWHHYSKEPNLSFKIESVPFSWRHTWSSCHVIDFIQDKGVSWIFPYNFIFIIIVKDPHPQHIFPDNCITFISNLFPAT